MGRFPDTGDIITVYVVRGEGLRQQVCLSLLPLAAGQPEQWCWSPGHKSIPTRGYA